MMKKKVTAAAGAADCESSSASRTSTATTAAAAAALLAFSIGPRPAASSTVAAASSVAFAVPPSPSRGLSSLSSSRSCLATPRHIEKCDREGRWPRRRGPTRPSFLSLRSRTGAAGDDDAPSAAFRSSAAPSAAGRLAGNKGKKGMSPSALSIATSATSIESSLSDETETTRRPMAMRVTPVSSSTGGRNKNNRRGRRKNKSGTALGATTDETETEASPDGASTASSSAGGRDDGPEEESKTKGEKSPSPSSPLSFREDVLDHRLLTREEELELADRIRRGSELRERMTSLVEEKMIQLADDSDAELSSSSGQGGGGGGDLYDGPDLDVELLSDLPYLAESRSIRRQAELRRKRAEEEEVIDPINPPVTHREESLLTEVDCISSLDLPGGRSELRDILQEASDARQTLVKCNMKLVVSIAKKWLSRGSNSDRHDAYDGGWDTPSLDELVQEGVLGLNRAAEKYDPARGVRFSTYATHWISAYVRTCVRDHLTSCLKVPYALHEIKRAYKAIMRNAHLEAPHDPLPTREDVARQIGVSPERLVSALAVTRTVLSIDAPIFGGGGTAGGGGGGGTAGVKGSGAGGDTAGVEQQLTLADALRSTETSPEEFVDLSFLRQCLENAMAAELSPHERDVVRLRLGLDDGHSKTAREVVDVCGGAISMADVRTAERRAYKKLRSPNAVHTYDLLSFLDPADVDYEMYSRPRF